MARGRLCARVKGCGEGEAMCQGEGVWRGGGCV